MVGQTKNLIEKLGAHTRAKGEAYFQQGRVRSAFVLCGKLNTSVMGSSQYYLSVDLKNGESVCSCPMEAGCKHVAAALLHADENSPQDYSPQFEKLDETEQKAFLERILVGNVLSALKGMGIFIDWRLEAAILEWRTTKVKAHQNEFMAFWGVFCINISLPDWIGLGKSVSKGFGTIERAGNGQMPNRLNERNPAGTPSGK
jgi:hypothetical protein